MAIRTEDFFRPAVVAEEDDEAFREYDERELTAAEKKHLKECLEYYHATCRMD